MSVCEEPSVHVLAKQPLFMHKRDASIYFSSTPTRGVHASVGAAAGPPKKSSDRSIPAKAQDAAITRTKH